MKKLYLLLLSIFFIGLSYGQLDSAIIIKKKKIVESFTDYYNKGKYEKAIDFAKKLHKIELKHKTNVTELPIIAQLIGKLHYLNKDWKNAEIWLSDAYHLNEPLKEYWIETVLPYSYDMFKINYLNNIYLLAEVSFYKQDFINGTILYKQLDSIYDKNKLTDTILKKIIDESLVYGQEEINRLYYPKYMKCYDSIDYNLDPNKVVKLNFYLDSAKYYSNFLDFGLELNKEDEWLLKDLEAIIRKYEGDYGAAISLYDSILQITEELYGNESLNYLQTKLYKANAYTEADLDSLATPIYYHLDSLKTALSITDTFFTSNLNINLDLINYQNKSEFFSKLNKECFLNLESGQLERALKTANELLNEAEVLSESFYLNIAHTQLGRCYLEMDSAHLALNFFMKSKRYLLTNSEGNGESYINNLNSISFCYEKLGNYAKALKFAIEATKLSADKFGKNHQKYSVKINKLAIIYRKLGVYNKALELLLEATKITKNILGENDLQYAIQIGNLALVYESLGNNAKALELLLKSAEITKNVLGKNHPNYASVLNDLALLYSNLRNFKKALEFSLMATEITSIIYGESHLDYANCVNSLALIYNNIGDELNALKFSIKANKIFKNKLGVSHPVYAISLSNLALIFQDLGNYSKALECSLEAADISKGVFGENHSDYALKLNNLASIYQDLGDYDLALRTSIQAAQITKNTLGAKHPSYSIRLINLGSYYQDLGDFKNAFKSYKEAHNLILNEVQSNYSYLTMKEKEIFNNSIFSNFTSFHGFTFSLRLQNPETIEEDFNLTLASSALLLNNSLDIREVLRTQNDSSLNNLFNDLNIIKKQIDFAYTLSVEELKNRNLNIDSLQNKTSKLERELVQKTSTFIDYPNYKLSKQDIEKALTKNQAAIQFNSFDYHNGKEWTDSTVYIAYVLLKNGNLEYIPLFEEAELTPLINKLSNNEGNTKELFNELYKLVWKPLEEHLEGIETIYYAPSGLLHKVPFSALVKNDSNYLTSTYNLHSLLSVSDIPELKEEQGKNTDGLIALIGGANFEATTAEEIDENSMDFMMNKSIGSLLRNMDRSGWSFLKGSLEEVNQINDIAKKAKQSSILKTGVDANEENFNAIVKKQNPKIFHIATHGYYIPPPKQKEESNFISTDENRFVNSDEPLLRSGILLSGANQKWVNNKEVDSEKDGILTALEVSRLDLSNTELVVLSACETGLGDIVGAEGVYGIQRGFKMAGVKNQLVSLWEVPDKETSEMMTLFYTALFGEKLSYYDAFMKAQTTMRNEYPEEPLKWAGFVLIE